MENIFCRNYFIYMFVYSLCIEEVVCMSQCVYGGQRSTSSRQLSPRTVCVLEVELCSGLAVRVTESSCRLRGNDLSNKCSLV